MTHVKYVNDWSILGGGLRILRKWLQSNFSTGQVQKMKPKCEMKVKKVKVKIGIITMAIGGVNVTQI